MMQPSEDLVSHVLREAYGPSMDWDEWATSRRGDSLVIARLRGIFALVQPFFRPQLGDEIDFKFWEDDWTGRGRLADAFPRLYSLALVPNATVWSAWSGAWTLTLPQALSDQRLTDFLSLQSQLADTQLLEATRDAWTWCQPWYSAKATYRLLCGQMPPKDTHIIHRCPLICKRRIPLKICIFS